MRSTRGLHEVYMRSIPGLHELYTLSCVDFIVALCVDCVSGFM